MAVKPLFVRYAQLKLESTTGGAQTLEFQCSATEIAVVSEGGDVTSISTQCPDGSFSETNPRTYSLQVTGVQDVEQADSLLWFAWLHEGETWDSTFYPKTDAQGVPVGYGMAGTVTVSLPDTIGGGEPGNYATMTLTWPYVGRPQAVDTAGVPMTPLSKSSASPGDVFPAEATVTAEDAPNAAKLGPLGYVADPVTDWTIGQKIMVGAYAFNWDGSAWASGASA